MKAARKKRAADQAQRARQAYKASVARLADAGDALTVAGERWTAKRSERTHVELVTACCTVLGQIDDTIEVLDEYLHAGKGLLSKSRVETLRYSRAELELRRANTRVQLAKVTKMDRGN